MKQRVIVTGLALAAAAMLFEPASAADTRVSKSNPDWPCQQILVTHLSPAAIWTGPAITDANKTPDPQIDDLAARLAQRRTPIADADAEIDAFAKAAGADRKQKLTQLFAVLFDKLDSERADVIRGLVRFGHRQIEMATKIRAENAKLHEEQDKSTAPDQANDAATPVSAAAKQLQWDVRIFQDQHKALTYVCEVPVTVEQRLFALARQIQKDMD